MAESKAKKTEKAPSRSDGEGAKKGFPQRIPRSGARRHHDRILTPAENRARVERQQKEAKERLDAQKGDKRKPGGWAGRRRER